MRRATVVVAAILTGFVAAACRRPLGTREARDFERMRRQQRYDAYDQSGFFANGAVMQAPPAHTVARGGAFTDAGEPVSSTVRTGKTGGAFVTAVPMALDDSALAAGAKQFAISCAPCHGAGGYGGGLIATNLVEKRPPSLRSPAVVALPAGQLFALITDGFGAMPPYGWQLTVAQRWDVAAYVRSLARQPTTPDALADSTMAAYLHVVDSLNAAGVPPALLPPPPRSAR